MAFEVRTTWREYLGRVISIGILIGALILGITVLEHARSYPRTDDAEVLANFIGMAPLNPGPGPIVPSSFDSLRVARTGADYSTADLFAG